MLPLPLPSGSSKTKEEMLMKLRTTPSAAQMHQQHPSLNKSNNTSSKFWFCLYGIIIMWVVFLFSFHYLSLEPLTYSQKPSQSTGPTKAIPIEISNPNKFSKQLMQSHSPKQEEDLMHIVFSTDCSFFQDWQTLLVFHSARTVKQKGKVTRIASGCPDEKKQELIQLYSLLYPEYSVHFTPDFKTDGKTKKKYDFYNKPYGVHHWLQNANPPIPAGTVIILLDPDMILLRPFSLTFRNNSLNLFMDGYDFSKEPIPEKISQGHPVAQLYGLGAPWAVNRVNKHFNRLEVCGEGSPCLSVTQKYGELHYSVGPPYLVEKEDLLRISDSWTQFVPRVYSRYPELLAEMYAYSMAAAHQNLPHWTMMSYMVSNTDMDEEGWKYIDTFQDNVCEEPAESGLFYPDHPLPTVLHYCQFYRSGEYGFQKRRIRKPLFDCDRPMMAHLPRELGKNRYKNRDGEILKLGPKQARRNSFMLCTIHRSINAMLRYYKSKLCTGSGIRINETESINLVAMKY